MKPGNPPPAAAVVALIDQHAGNLLVKHSPLGQVLPAIRAWVLDVERRLQLLERKP